MNWKCKECGHVCARKGGIITHLSRHHDTRGSYEGMIESTSEKVTHPKQKYKEHKQTYSEQERNVNYKCKKCGHICNSESGIRAHLVSRHQIPARKENFEETSDKANNPPYKKRKKRKLSSRPNVFNKLVENNDDNRNKGNEKDFLIEIKISSAGMLVITPMPIKISQIVYPEPDQKGAIDKC